MKKLIASISLALAAAVAAGTPAAAQEAFQGPYAGIEAGWNKNKVERAETDIGRADIGRSRDSATAGIFAGYNYKVSDSVVLSAEGGFSMGFDDAITRSGAGTLASIDPEYSFNLGARAGYLADNKTLLYVRGGYENLRGSVRVTDAADSRYGKNTFDGWSIGGGVERMLTEKVSARIEYRYSDLGGNDTKFQRHQALVGVAYHF
ncbi:outer membrane protein [Novosphingobium gossypii]|uniref:outer membrane protein n=1 Tax=Novosphingobium gossypii TaxID=1604774 RepID=UPI003D263338